MAQSPGTDPDPDPRHDDAHPRREALLNFFTAVLLMQAETGEMSNATMLLVGAFVTLLLAGPPTKS